MDCVCRKGSNKEYPVCLPCEEGKKEQVCEEEEESSDEGGKKEESNEEEEYKLLMKVRVRVERRLMMGSILAFIDG